MASLSSVSLGSDTQRLGVQLPDRAKQTLCEFPVCLDGLLGRAWTDTVERQGRLVEERETVQCLNRGARPSTSTNFVAPSAKKKGFGIKLNTPARRPLVRRAGRGGGGRRTLPRGLRPLSQLSSSKLPPASTRLQPRSPRGPRQGCHATWKTWKFEIDSPGLEKPER